MSLAQELTRANKRAIAVRDSITLRFTLRDQSGNPIDLSSVTVGHLHVRMEPGGPLLIDATIANGKMVVDPDQSAGGNRGVLRVSFSGGASGDTDRDPVRHLYDSFVELSGAPKYFVKAQTPIEFIDVITKV